jgi:hypothetical protein
VKSREIPKSEIPGFDSIGANEYIVDVTHPGAVDFISTMDTPYPWELNIWYHTLNVAFMPTSMGAQLQRLGVIIELGCGSMKY